MHHKIFNNINKFDDFIIEISKLKANEKGYMFELLIKYIFLLHPNYRNITKHIYLYADIPQKLLKKCNLPDKDKGIDLLLITNDNEYIPIQCKFRTDKFKTVNWNNLATFVGQAFGVANFKTAIYVTNTYDINEEICRSDKIQCIYGEFFYNLNEEFFNNIRNYIENKKIEYNKILLRDYQIEFLAKTIKHFKDNDRGFASIACGTGKSIMSYYVDKFMFNNLTILFVPSLYLLSQIFKDWVRESVEYKNIKFLLVGSDTDIDEKNYKSNGLMITTDYKIIKEKIELYKNNKLIIISTYQSSNKLKDGLKNKTVDLIIFDEAHKTVADNSYFSYALDDKYIKAKKRLFVTATPKIYKSNDDNIDDTKIVSMDNDKIYGKEIYNYNIRKGIDEKFLSEYEILALAFTTEQLNNYKLNNKLVKFDKENINFHYLATALMIKQLFSEDKISHLLTYHSNIKNSKEFTELLIKICGDDYDINHIDGSMSAKKKQKLINDFTANKKSILCSAKVLNEGINIPIIDSVCFVESRSSSIDIIQCIGRALRLHKDKDIARILMPIIRDEEKDSSYKPLIDLVKNIGEYDGSVIEYFTCKNKEKRKLINVQSYKNGGKIEKIGVNINIDDILKEMKTYIINKYYKWYDNYKIVINFVKENCKIPSKKSKNDFEKQLGHWCSNNRVNKINNNLSCEKIKLLEQINEWYWDDNDVFNLKYKNIILFTEKEKKLPSEASANIKEKKLARWCTRQRRNYKNNLLSNNKIKLLEKINGWFWDKLDKFNFNYNKLINYIKIYNKLPSKYSKNEEEILLGDFCYLQKCKKRENTLSNNKIKLLEKINGWFWDDNDLFNLFCNEIDIFIKKGNRLPSIISKDKKEIKLGRWCIRQRNNKKKGILTNDQIKMLENIDKWSWNISKRNQFMPTYNELKIFIDKHKRLPLKRATNKIEKKLGLWCTVLRAKYKNNNLKNNEIELLEKFDVWFWDKKDNFDKNYKEIIKFIDNNNRFPSRSFKDENEKKLSIWINNQRKKYKDNKTSDEHIKLLEKIKGWYWENINNINI
jgi:superfamily II DNA or RNA helicase